MIEAVGEEYWETYFRTIDERLAPGGIAAVQAILMSHERLVATKHSYGWIQKHIFPGGLIQSLQAMSETTDAATTLRMSAVEAFGPTTPRPCGAGARPSSPAGPRSAPSASTRPSAASGSSTSPTARRASRRATSTSPRCASNGRAP